MHGERLFRWVGLAACAALGACAPKSELPPPVPEVSTSRCEAIFVLAPTGFMRYMDLSEYPMLASEGREQDLPVFCSSAEARTERDERVAAERLPLNFWSVFRLEGQWETDVVEVEPGLFRMRHPATLYARAGDNPQ